MGTQISIKLSEAMFSAAKSYARVHGYDTVQDFIRDLIRVKLFEQPEQVGGVFTALASEPALARVWLSKEEDKAWHHLQKDK